MSFASSPGNATVTFDQRIFGSGGASAPVPQGFMLLDANGTPVAAGAGQNINFGPAAAGPMQATVHFNPSAFTTAKALEICGPPDSTLDVTAAAECTAAGATGESMFTSNFAPAAPNVQQILSPFATWGAHATRARAPTLEARDPRVQEAARLLGERRFGSATAAIASKSACLASRRLSAGEHRAELDDRVVGLWVADLEAGGDRDTVRAPVGCA